MSFGTELYKWRKAKGLTQKELAVASGVNVSYISNLERDFSPTAKGGKPQASLDLVDRLAKVLDVNADKVRLAAGYAPENAVPENRVSLPNGLQIIGFEDEIAEDDLREISLILDMKIEKSRRR